MAVDLDSQSFAEIRSGVLESLPEISQIKDEALREKVIEVHARALAETRFKRIEDIPASGVPDSPLMKKGTQADHYRATTTMALGMARGMQEVLPHVEIVLAPAPRAAYGKRGDEPSGGERPADQSSTAAGRHLLSVGSALGTNAVGASAPSS